jgi:hypothetical protein
MSFKPYTDVKFKNTSEVSPGFPKNIMLWLFETFGFLFPELGTWQFYVVFGLYSYIFTFVLYFIKSRLQEWIGTVEDDNLYLTKTKEQQEQERKQRQKEAEEILSKYFKVTKVEDNDLTKNDEIFNENFKKEKID